VLMRADTYEATATYCRVSKDENTCDLLAKLLEYSEKLWAEFFSRRGSR
jgi:hypothetical protein